MGHGTWQGLSGKNQTPGSSLAGVLGGKRQGSETGVSGAGRFRCHPGLPSPVTVMAPGRSFLLQLSYSLSISDRCCIHFFKVWPCFDLLFYLHIFWFFKKNVLFMYVFLTVLDLGCCAWAFSSCSKQGLLSGCSALASLAAEHGL